jgi:hypothetical protein
VDPREKRSGTRLVQEASPNGRPRRTLVRTLRVPPASGPHRPSWPTPADEVPATGRAAAGRRVDQAATGSRSAGPRPGHLTGSTDFARRSGRRSGRAGHPARQKPCSALDRHAPLPGPADLVPELGMALGEASHEAGELAPRVRARNQMPVGRHQAPGVELDAGCPTLLCRELLKPLEIGIADEDRGPRVGAIQQMTDDLRMIDSWWPRTWHWSESTGAGHLGKEFRPRLAVNVRRSRSVCPVSSRHAISDTRSAMLPIALPLEPQPQNQSLQCPGPRLSALLL